MGLADALIFALAALVDLAVLFLLRWRRRRRGERERLRRALRRFALAAAGERS